MDRHADGELQPSSALIDVELAERDRRRMRKMAQAMMRLTEAGFDASGAAASASGCMLLTRTVRRRKGVLTAAPVLLLPHQARNRRARRKAR